ncbi:MAG: hypothetical protein QOF63_3423, partial [Thermoanaerobaculia bacterium]|nr:hypothetical protein [Thermoanaerobaculia bacterium]
MGDSVSRGRGFMKRNATVAGVVLG